MCVSPFFYLPDADILGWSDRMPNVINLTDELDLKETSCYPYAQWDFDHLNPVQSRLLEMYQKPNSVVIAASTSAGKTVCAEIFAAHDIRARKKKVIYVGPLRALAQEKKDDWSNQDYHFGDLSVSICTGDYRLTEDRIKELDNADIIVMTPEMLASRLRNNKSEKSRFLQDVGCCIFDESHLLTVPQRGDHIEVALMKLSIISPDVRVVMLSATMPNVQEIAQWVAVLTQRDVYCLESAYRPVPLDVHYETYYDGDKTYDGKELEKVATAVGIVNYYRDDKFIIFVHTKRTGQYMVEALQQYGIKSEFHNANLDLKRRLSLESRFRDKNSDLRVIVATSTVAWGINLPARRAIITGIDRGLQPVENYDIWQMVGRTGRKGLDPKGDAYILVPESKKKESIARLKLNPPIRSQLLDEAGGKYKTLAFHIVSEIHHRSVTTKEEFQQWFRRSLAYHQSKKMRDDILDSTIDSLLKCRAIVLDDGQYEVTPVGIVSSMFYYSPFDVSDYRHNFSKLFERGRQDDDMWLSLALANVDSNRFGIVNRQEKDEIASFGKKLREMCGEDLPDSIVKSALCYHNILNGRENPVLSAHQSMMRHDSERIVEVVSMLDSMSGKWQKQKFLRNLKVRLMYGVRTELIQLCTLPNVGRVRAEKLWKSGLKSIEQIAGCAPQRLALILGVREDVAIKYVQSAQQVQLNKPSSSNQWADH